MNITARKTRNNKNRHRIIYYDKLDRKFSDRRMHVLFKNLRNVTIKLLGNTHYKNPESEYPD